MTVCEVRPELVPEWSKEKNLPLKPDEITFGSNNKKKYGGEGACGHE
ncbi:zinc-ribbon domain-containing protein [Clostridium sp.]|nr:zinc-ribbon domain-containing protein [Clostridium sp.]